MSERFEDKAFSSVGIESNRNRSNEFANKETPKPTKPDETQDTEVTREITVRARSVFRLLVVKSVVV